MLILLSIIVFLIMLLSYKQNKKVVFSPSFVCSSSYMIAILFLFLLKDQWNVNFKFYTIFVICLGLFSMCVGEMFYSKRISLNISNEYKENFIQTDSLHVNKTLVKIILAINFLGSYLYLQEVYRIIGGNIIMLSEDMSYYRNAIVFDGEKISRMVTQFKLFTNATSLLFCFIIIFNLYKGKRFKGQLIYIFACIPYLINTFLSGGRLGFLTFVASLLWLVYIVGLLGLKNNNQYLDYIKRYSKTIIIVTAVMLFSFFSLRLAVGRLTSEDASFLEYIGEYIAAPSLNFDYFLERCSLPDITEFDIHKSDTFMGLGQTLSNFDHKNNSYNPLFDFRTGPHGEKFGNVYTALARYYSDFGLYGVIFLPFLIGLVLEHLLSNILNNNKKKFDRKIIFLILLYSYLYNPLVIFAADDVFFRSFRHGSIEIIILLYVMSRYLLKIKKHNILFT